MASSLWLVGLSGLLSGCFGLIEPLESTSGGDSTDSSDAAADGAADAGASGGGTSAHTGGVELDGDCPPSQWDCSRAQVSCSEDEYGIARSTISGICSCDRSRPEENADCAADEIRLCGELAGSEQELSCRCVSSSGWYCAACSTLGLYSGGQKATGCRGPGGQGARCGCGG